MALTYAVLLDACSGRERAEALAAEFPEMEVDIKLMDELWPVVKSHEVIYTSTSASGCLLTKDEMLAQGVTNPMVIVDISVPRNVEQEVSELEGVFSYNVDNLKEVVDRNTAMRKKQIIEVRQQVLLPWSRCSCEDRLLILLVMVYVCLTG